MQVCLALLLVLVFSTPAFHHAHTTSAAAHWQETEPVKADATSEPCCPDSSDLLDGASCSIANGCSLWISVESSSAAIAPSKRESTAILPDDTILGRAPPPQFRPPKLAVNA